MRTYLLTLAAVATSWGAVAQNPALDPLAPSDPISVTSPALPTFAVPSQTLPNTGTPAAPGIATPTMPTTTPVILMPSSPNPSMNVPASPNPVAPSTPNTFDPNTVLPSEPFVAPPAGPNAEEQPPGEMPDPNDKSENGGIGNSQNWNRYNGRDTNTTKSVAGKKMKTKSTSKPKKKKSSSYDK